MKNLVFITNSNPFPGNSGGTKKTRLLIDNLLNRGYVIDLLFLTLPSDERKNIDLLIDKYKNSSINIHFCENKNNIRSVKNFIKSIFLFINIHLCNFYMLKNFTVIRFYCKSLPQIFF